jgi:hypothetical protein
MTTYAEARVACPHRSTSAAGVNHLISHSSFPRVMKAVSERLFSMAIYCIVSSVTGSVRTHIAAGFPVKGASAKASTWKMGIVFIMDLEFAQSKIL